MKRAGETAAFVVFVGGFLLAALAAAALLVGTIFLVAKPINEAVCNGKGERYGLPADYRLLTDRCWLTLPNGTDVDADQYRVVEARP